MKITVVIVVTIIFISIVAGTVIVVIHINFSSDIPKLVSKLGPFWNASLVRLLILILFARRKSAVR